MPPEVAKWSAVLGLVTIICSVAASYAITQSGVTRNTELIADHENRIRAVETTVAQQISSMSADIEWIRYYVECMAQTELPRTEARGRKWQKH